MCEAAWETVFFFLKYICHKFPTNVNQYGKQFFCKNYICHKFPTNVNQYGKHFFVKIIFVTNFPPFSQILSPYIELRGIWGITNTPTWLADYTDPQQQQKKISCR